MVLMMVTFPYRLLNSMYFLKYVPGMYPSLWHSVEGLRCIQLGIPEPPRCTEESYQGVLRAFEVTLNSPYMSRCEYDGVFYRVFCVTLLATALTFTVILTNVFIDIDGLLSKKGKQNYMNEDNGKHNVEISETTDLQHDTSTQRTHDNNYIDDPPETVYRTKRSLDSQKLHYNVKTGKMIKALATQLEKLLEKLYDEVNKSVENLNGQEEVTIDLNYAKIPSKKEYVMLKLDDDQFNDYDDAKGSKENAIDFSHLAMHSTLLQSILGHRDTSDIFERLVKNFNKGRKGSKRVKHIIYEKDLKTFLFKALQNANMKITNHEVSVVKAAINLFPQKELELFMKTIIEIRPLNLAKEKHKFIYFEENNKGTHNIDYEQPHDVIKLEYDDFTNSNHYHELFNILHIIPKHNDRFHYLRKPLKYLKKYSTYNQKQIAYVNGVDKNGRQRAKRQVKIRYEYNDDTTPKIKPVRKGLKKTDDELYVEIETHFDGTGVRGERKKKLVKSLIDRIQKAIRSDSLDSDKEKMHQHMQIKKRTQNSLKQIHLNKDLMPLNSVEHRQLNPINKILAVTEIPQDAEVKPVDNWEEPYYSSMANIENSLEIGNTDHDNILSNGVPQRIQVPLNIPFTDVPAKVQNSYVDAGNATLFLKDIDGSGFSVGFNQYVDQPPDVDSMKLFSGLENLIKTYHEDYDQNINENTNVNEVEDSVENPHKFTKRDVDLERNEHILLRRSVQEVKDEGYHSDASKIIFNKNKLPYENIQRPSHKSMSSNYEYEFRNYDYNPDNFKIFTNDIKIKELPVELNNDIFEKKLKPPDIFNIANIFPNKVQNRNKRSLKVHKITNLKSRIKLNRYINTKQMETKSLFLKNKRNKRSAGTIRIVASDNLNGMPRQSEENVFLVSGENLFSNRAVLKEIELPESDIGDDAGEEHYDDALPYVFEEPNPLREASYITNIFDTKYKHNSLMSKYPHIFTGNIKDSKEVHFGHENDYLISRNNKPQLKLENFLGMHITTENNGSSEKDAHMPEIVNAIVPPKSNYKVTVKILPKNLTNAPSGFKETHTVINKTYNNNGLQYFSLVNVSEISKIEKINKTQEMTNQLGDNISEQKKLQEQEYNMKLLLALQKDKIEQQLLHLNKEKEGLENILREKNGIKERSIHDLFKEFMHMESDKLNDDLEFLRDSSQVHVPTTVKMELTTSSSIPTTINQDLKVKEDKHKVTIKVDKPIKENEHLTSEILSKINKNTDILESFLKKLSDKFEHSVPLQTTQHAPAVEHVTEHLRGHVDMPNDWGMNLHQLHDTHFNDHLSNKNDSHYAIPFVYAYQSPYLPTNHQSPVPMAKIVYHGHIHTNAVHKHSNDGRKYNGNNGINSIPNHPSTSLLSHDGNKFFIDALARDVIAVPPKHGQKSDFTATSGNTTKNN